eukprot:565720-Pyramimonas_sp.AAC.1
MRAFDPQRSHLPPVPAGSRQSFSNAQDTPPSSCSPSTSMTQQAPVRTISSCWRLDAESPQYASNLMPVRINTRG